MGCKRGLSCWSVQLPLAVSAIALSTLVVAGPARASTPTFSGQPASTIIDQTRTAMAAESSVTSTGRGYGTGSGGAKVEISEKNYSGTASGTQQLGITSRDGSAANLPAASTSDVDGRVYVNANAAFWTTSASLSDPQAVAMANRWVQVPQSNTFYALAAADLTMQSLIADLFSAKSFHKGRIVSVDGVRAIAITYTNTGNDAGPATCDVALGGRHLPVAVSLDGITFHLTSWGATKVITDPVGAVPLPPASSGGEATT